jgi:predicted HTH domain antitoxin
MPDYLLHPYPGESTRWTICEICKGTKSHLLTDIGETFFNSITAVFDGLISAVTGGFLTDFWSSLVAGEDVVTIISESLHDHVIDLIGNTETAIVTVLGGFENQVATHFTDLLGITDLQTRIADSLQREIDAITDKWKAETDLIESEEEAAARELAARTITVLSDRATFYQDQYSVWMARFVEMEEETEGLQFETSIAGLEAASHMLDIDLMMIHDLAEERNVEAVVGMTEEIAQSLVTADEWARDVAIKPLAYGDMAMQVLSQYLDIPAEEIKEQLRTFTQLQYEVAGEMIPEFKAGE